MQVAHFYFTGTCIKALEYYRDFGDLGEAVGSLERLRTFESVDGSMCLDL